MDIIPPGNKDFTELVQKVLNKEYSLELDTRDVYVRYINNKSFDLADTEANSFVEIFSNYQSEDFSRVKNKVNELIKFLKNIRNNKEFNFFIILRDAYAFEEKQQLIKTFPHLNWLNFLFFDESDITKFVNKHNIKIPEADKSIGDKEYEAKLIELASEESKEKNLIDTEVENAVAFTTKMSNLINSGKNFFAAGHSWGDDDQMDRFIEYGIWENGHEDKLVNVVNRANVGDIIFLKSTFKKNGAGTLRVKAIGVVTNNPRDGHTLHINWMRTKDIDLVGLGGVRAAINQIGKENVPKTLKGIEEQLPELFDIIEELESISGQATPLKPKFKGEETGNNEKHYWWINAFKGRWNMDGNEIGYIQSYSTHDTNKKERTVFENFFTAQKGDLAIVYQFDEQTVGFTKAIFEIVDGAKNRQGDYINFKLIYKFTNEEQFNYQQISGNSLFSQSEIVLNNNKGTLFKLNTEQFEFICSKSNFFKPKQEIIFNSLQKTTINNDGEYTTEDLLNIENDVRSFALTLAAKDVKPPIAIALFGAWGSGKSFFMQHLAKRTEELSTHQRFLGDAQMDIQPNEKYFCNGIAQIHFNAWSYLDANLWGGLVTSIFEKLDEYITNTTKSKIAKLKVLEKLTERLRSLKVYKDSENNRKSSLEKIKVGYQNEIDNIKKASNKQLFQNIKSLIIEDKNLSTLFDKLPDEDNLKNKIVEFEFSEIEKEYNVWRKFFQHLKNPKTLIKALLVVFLFIAGSYCINHFFEFGKAKLLPYLLTVIPGYISWRGVKNKYKSISTYIGKFNELATAGETFQIKLDGFKEMQNETQNQIQEIETHVFELDKKIEAYEHDLKYDLTDVTIADFLNERAHHDDYKNKTGIVSVIRKDFETLSELFSEKEQNNENQIQKDREDLSEQFEEGKKLDRIILYIDDLDRCSDKKVLEVIQAVHLLLAFPLFNVVVGVDIKCARNALIYKNLMQYNNVRIDDKIKTEDIHLISPDDYLEKIFQIPFHLKEPSSDNIGDMVTFLLEEQIEEESSEQKSSTNNSNVKENTHQERPKEIIKTEKQKDEEERIRKAREEALKKRITPQALKLTKTEFLFLKEMVCLVGSIPRTVKRFINIYRIIRAHQDFDTNSKDSEKDLLAIMFVLAIHIGKHKELAESLRKTIVSNKEKPLHEIIQSHISLTIINKDIEDLDIYDILKKITGTEFEKHLASVARFSFGCLENGLSNTKQELNAK